LNVVSPIPGYQRGVCEISGLLTHEDNVATQSQEVALRIRPDDSELLLFRVVEGVAAVGARRVGDNVDAFHRLVRENI
jgi:hypothetical protein